MRPTLNKTLPAALLLVTLAGDARGATEYPDPYSCTTVKGRCTGTDARYPVQFKSLFDGVKDRYYLRFPDGYDKNKAYPLFVQFHAWCAGDSAIADPRMLRQVANDNQVIFVGHWQRGGVGSECGASFLGDGKKESAAAAAAAKKDIGELLNEMAARFKINYVIAAGSSMGGYTALRMVTLFPKKVHAAMATATALQRKHNTFPEPTAILNAAKAKVFDELYIYNVIGSADSQFIAVNRELNGLMKGKTYWSYHEVAGVGHSNFFADDWNHAKGHCKDPNLATSHCWYVSTKDTPNLWSGLKAWEKAHGAVVKGLLEPDCTWKAPAKMSAWYITEDLHDRGGRPWPRKLSCGKDAGPGKDGAGPGKDGAGPGKDGASGDGPTQGGDQNGSCSCYHASGNSMTPLLLLAAVVVISRRKRRA